MGRDLPWCLFFFVTVISLVSSVFGTHCIRRPHSTEECFRIRLIISSGNERTFCHYYRPLCGSGSAVYRLCVSSCTINLKNVTFDLYIWQTRSSWHSLGQIRWSDGQDHRSQFKVTWDKGEIHRRKNIICYACTLQRETNELTHRQSRTFTIPTGTAVTGITY